MPRRRQPDRKPPTMADFYRAHPEFQEYVPDYSKWNSWQEWAAARASARYRFGIRMLPSLQAMTEKGADQ